jgi:hypothetical protein
MIKTTTKNSGEVLYDAPSVNVLDVQSEGLLCVSASDWNLGGAGTYGEDDINDNGSY